MGEAESDPTVILSADDETASLPGHGGLPRGAAEKTRPDVLRTPKRLGELLGEDGVPTLEGPVLVSHAGNPAEELVRATVYPVASMIAGAAPRPERLEDELARFGVGRTSANDIVIDDLAVSKRHAAIVRHRGCRWSVVDEGSSNGTFVDARRLEVGRPVPLGVLTTIRFGPRARFAFMHPAAFSDYASSVRAEARRRGTALLRIPLPSLDRLSCDTARRTQPGGTFEPLAARIHKPPPGGTRRSAVRRRARRPAASRGRHALRGRRRGRAGAPRDRADQVRLREGRSRRRLRPRRARGRCLGLFSLRSRVVPGLRSCRRRHPEDLPHDARASRSVRASLHAAVEPCSTPCYVLDL